MSLFALTRFLSLVDSDRSGCLEKIIYSTCIMKNNVLKMRTSVIMCITYCLQSVKAPTVIFSMNCSNNLVQKFRLYLCKPFISCYQSLKKKLYSRQSNFSHEQHHRFYQYIYIYARSFECAFSTNLDEG